MKGKTSTGFEFEVDVEAVADDYEYVELLCDIDAGEGYKVPAMVKKFLGAEQAQKLKEHVRDERGKVSTQKIQEEMEEIFGICSENGEVKN